MTAALLFAFDSASGAILVGSIPAGLFMLLVMGYKIVGLLQKIEYNTRNKQQ